MLNLDTIDQETLLARGRYATVRGAHEDSKRDLQITCSEMQGILNSILKRSTSDPCEDVADLIVKGNEVLADIERQTVEIESLAAQRKALKSEAWPK